MTPFTFEDIRAMFARKGAYHFARWGRPIAPIVFGVDDDSLAVMKDAMARTVAITGGVLAETDPELGANFMWFFVRDWDELAGVPNLDQLIPNMPELLKRLSASGAQQYRNFTFDDEGGIKFCVTLHNMSGPLADLPIQVLVTGETVQCLALWSEEAFSTDTPIGVIEQNGLCIVKPNFASLIRAAYDPVLPVAATDDAHALRLAPRAEKLLKDMEPDA